MNSVASTSSRRGALSALGLVAALVLSGCGGSSKNSSSSNPPAGSASSTASGTSAAPSTSGSASAALTGEAALVKTAYEKFFAPATPQAEAITLLQNGPTFAKAIAEQAASPMSKGSSVEVSGVTVLSAAKATVTFSVLINGSPVLSNQSGWAVKEGGAWKVAATTFCGLVAMGGASPSACMDAKATTLPG